MLSGLWQGLPVGTQSQVVASLASLRPRCLSDDDAATSASSTASTAANGAVEPVAPKTEQRKAVTSAAARP